MIFSVQTKLSLLKLHGCMAAWTHHLSHSNLVYIASVCYILNCVISGLGPRLHGAVVPFFGDSTLLPWFVTLFSICAWRLGCTVWAAQILNCATSGLGPRLHGGVVPLSGDNILLPWFITLFFTCAWRLDCIVWAAQIPLYTALVYFITICNLFGSGLRFPSFFLLYYLFHLFHLPNF